MIICHRHVAVEGQVNNKAWLPISLSTAYIGCYTVFVVTHVCQILPLGTLLLVLCGSYSRRIVVFHSGRS